MDHRTEHDAESDPHDIAGDTLGQPAADDIAARDEARQPQYTGEEAKSVTIPADEVVGDQADADAGTVETPDDGELRQPPEVAPPDTSNQPPPHPAEKHMVDEQREARGDAGFPAAQAEPGPPRGGNSPDEPADGIAQPTVDPS